MNNVQNTRLSSGKFRLEQTYKEVTEALEQTGILAMLPLSSISGVTGFDGKEYPLPSLEEVLGLFELNGEMVNRKILQGFDCLQMTPMAMPVSHLVDLLRTKIIRLSAEGKIYQPRRHETEPLIPTRVNKEKQVWIWERLEEVFDTDDLIYFPEEYSVNHHGQTKREVIHNNSICAIPGWSVGLVESLPIVPQPGEGKTISGRQQIELGHSPKEYMQILQSEQYQGETGKTLEDFLTAFLMHLETTNEISNDRIDDNCLWCLGQYIKIPWAECVPTGWWHRQVGRLRLDMHRTGNKQCTKNCGVSTIVRLGNG